MSRECFLAVRHTLSGARKSARLTARIPSSPSDGSGMSSGGHKGLGVVAAEVLGLGSRGRASARKLGTQRGAGWCLTGHGHGSLAFRCWSPDNHSLFCDP
jgi:hypothetical protein